MQFENDWYGPAVVGAVEEDSPAAEAGIAPGDTVLRIDGEPLRDLIDYYVLMADDVDHAFVIERSGESLTVEIHCEGRPAGLEFTSQVFGALATCTNECMFCFVDQLPAGLRESLYVKDDDYRLSFLSGNFITLSNLDERDIERIVEERLSPLYVSLHSTEPDVRGRIFGNGGNDRALRVLSELLDEGIHVHAQIVLVRGVNDREHLDATLADLQSDYSGVASIGVVPVGITGRGRRPMDPAYGHDTESAHELLAQIETWRRGFGTEGPYAADEFFFLAGVQPPEESYYRGSYPQSENGIGLARMFLSTMEGSKSGAAVCDTVVTTPMGKWVLSTLELEELGTRLLVCGNSLFGPRVNVCGLLPGRDVASVLGEAAGAERVCIPGTAISEEGLFIDGLSIEDIERKTGTRLTAVEPDARELIDTVLGKGLE